MKNKYFIIIAIIHLLLVVADMIINCYQQDADSPRYLFVADEFTSFNFLNPDPGINCYTAPGYPIFLALIKLVTRHDKFLIAIIQSLLYSISLYYLIFNLFKKKYLSYSLCLAGYFMVLFSPEIFQSNGHTMTESFCGSLLLLTSGSMIAEFNKNRTKILFVISICFLVLSKFEYILILPVIIMPLVSDKRNRLAMITIFSLTLILTVNGLKNYHIYEKFNPFCYSSGTVMYGGNNRNGDGSWHITKKNLSYLPADQIDKYKSIYELNPKCFCVKQDSFYKAMAIDAWKANWIFQLKIIPVKFLKLWLIPSNMDLYTFQTEFKKGLLINSLFEDSHPWYTKFKHGFYLAIYWLYLLAIIFGFYLKIRRAGFSRADLFVISLILIFSILYSIPFYGSGRFHIPFFGLLALYSSYTIQYLDNIVFKSRLYKVFGNQKQQAW